MASSSGSAEWWHLIDPDEVRTYDLIQTVSARAPGAAAPSGPWHRSATGWPYPSGGCAKDSARGGTIPSPSSTEPELKASQRVFADDVNTACLRAMKHLRRRTGQDVAGRGGPPWNVETSRPDGWFLVGQVWLKTDPATRWHVWCQAGT